MSKRTLFLLLGAFLLGVLTSELLLHGAFAGNQIGCSYDPLPFGLNATFLGHWLQVYCGA
jgi:hypothetical protein